MIRLFSWLFLVLAFCTAYAQAPEVPAEKANLATVVIFLALFVASCIGFLAYAWWAGKKKKKQEKDE